MSIAPRWGHQYDAPCDQKEIQVRAAEMTQHNSEILIQDYIHTRFKQHNTSRRDYVRLPGRIWNTLVWFILLQRPVCGQGAVTITGVIGTITSSKATDRRSIPISPFIRQTLNLSSSRSYASDSDRTGVSSELSESDL